MKMKVITIRSVAIVSGTALLIMAVAAFLAMDLLGQLDLFEDLQSQTSVESILRKSIFYWLLILICDILVAWGLYVYLSPVSKAISLLTACFRYIYVVFLGIAITSLVLCLVMVLNPKSVNGQINTNLLAIQVKFFVQGFKEIWSTGLLLFGFHLLGLGYLVLKSGLIPKLLGVLILIAGLGYLITNLCHLLFHNYGEFKVLLEAVFMLPMILGEIGLSIWLVWKGGRTGKELSSGKYSFPDPAQ